MTNKTIKNELKVYLDQLQGLVSESDRPLARQLTHDVYDLFKNVKQPEKETVVVQVPAADRSDKMEIESLQQQLKGAKFREGKLAGELNTAAERNKQHMDNTPLLVTGGMLAGYTLGKKPDPDRMEEHNKECLGLLIRILEIKESGVLKWADVWKVCLTTSRSINQISIAENGIEYPIEKATEAMFDGLQEAFRMLSDQAAETVANGGKIKHPITEE